MNKKQKIIVSIVGITIVLLALLGFTYAYYLTRIEGNTNTNSISITTADLKLVYSENSPEIITENNIMPGTTIGEKTFTVSNTGNSAVEDYKVVLEYAVIENVVPSVFVRPQDFEITMTCVSKNIQTDEESGTCKGYTGTWNNESFEMTTNDIADNIKHEYTLTIYYANPDIDQSDDMGKNLNLKVQIYGANETSTITGTINNVDETYAMKLNSNPKISTIKKITDSEGNVKYQYKFIGVEPNIGNDSHTLTLVNKSNVEQSTGNITIKKGTNSNIDGSTITVKDNQTNIFLTTTNGSSLTNSATFNPYSNNTNTLAYHIINNAMNNTNGTYLLDNPITTPAEEINLETEAVLSTTEDDYETSYYFRGNVKNNYVNFAGMCWRIVRVAGDGSTKLILEDATYECNNASFTGNWNIGRGTYGYDEDEYYNIKLNYLNPENTGMALAFKNYQTTLAKKIDSNIGDTPTSEQVSNTLSSKLKVGDWCLDDSAYSDTMGANRITDLTPYYSNYNSFYYGAYTRIYEQKTASLKCNGTIIDDFNDNGESSTPMYVATLTADEIVYAGADSNYSENYNYYLMNEYSSSERDNWWALSPYSSDGTDDYYYASVFLLGDYGDLSYDDVGHHPRSFRPAVSLKSGTTFVAGGNGTKSQPYEIG